MTLASTRDAPARPEGAAPRPVRLAVLVALGVALALVLAAVHLTQGTAALGVGDLLGLGGDSGPGEQASAVLVASRVPRLLTGVLVGVALGVAGALLQSVARNPLAAPDTLAVDAGAYLALVTASVIGVVLPAPFTGAVAFVGGLAAAALVLTLASGGTGPTRLVLAGTAIALALQSVSISLLLLFEEETLGLYAWRHGSLAQSGDESLLWMAPVAAFAVLGALLCARRLDLHGLGDDAAAVLGVDVRRVRAVAVLIAVALSAAAVTVAGPLAFVGLIAPALVRLLIPLVPGLARHRALLPVSALSGVLVVLGADVVARAALGAQLGGVELPTGVVTSLVGGAVLVVLACRARASTPSRPAPAARPGRHRGPLAAALVLVAVAVLTAGAAVAAILLGDAVLLLGDVGNWVAGRSGPVVTYVLDARMPRVVAALAAGAALAVAGTVIQAACRNPLAEPGIIGVTGGAGAGAVIALALVPTLGAWALAGSAFAGATLASLLVFGLAARARSDTDQLVLVGVGVSVGTAALTTTVIVLTDPYDLTTALTWLSGSTYGRTVTQVLPVLGVLALLAPWLWRARRELDLMAVDDDTPRIVGVRLDRARPVLLGATCLLTATAVSAVGVLVFVGLVAPHAARALVGARHARVLPLAALLGALLVSIADTLGRTVIAPGQLGVGLLTAIVGAPYFVWLLWRPRTRESVA